MFCDVQIVKNIEKRTELCHLLIADGELSPCWKKHEATRSILILCSSSFDLKY